MFVSRTKYDTLERIADVLRGQAAQLERVNTRLEQSLTDSRDELKRAMEYNRTLVQTIVEMRREGFANAPKVATQPERSARANVEEAIRLAAGGDKGHASILRAWVASKRAEGSDEDAIAHELLQPTPADEEGVPV